MMKQLIFVFLTSLTVFSYAQTKFIYTQTKSAKAPDSVIVKAGKSSVIVVIRDSADIKTIRRYDIDAIVEDALRQIETDTSKRISSGLHYQYKKYPGLRFSFEPDADTLVTKRLRERARLLALEELEWLEMQEDFLESGSEFDRAELKRNIKERAERLKEKTKVLSDPETGEEYEFRFETEKGNDQDSGENEDEENKPRKRTYQSTHFDLGTLNYLSDGKFPDGDNAPYTLSPQGSTYFAVTNIFRTRLANRMFVEWGLGLGAYYFRFQNDNMQMLKTGTGIDFTPDTRDLEYRKSKFVNHFVQFSLVPVIDFGGNKRKPGLFDGVESASFRFGLGPYISYRTDSYTKRVYKEDGEKQRIRDRDNFYFNNVRYGLRMQFGYREVDLFFSYDLNTLFVAGRAPELNTFSFGVSF